jgi:S-DNA-T family DNA segregation ATPase FtsK/SpoIIIE
MIASPLASYISYVTQKKEYEKSKSESLKVFENEINSKTRVVGEYKEKQKKIINNNYLSPAECMDIAARQELRVGERRPQDADFLTFRLGLGVEKSRISVAGISVEGRDPIYNSLYNKADKLVKDAAEIEDTAIICDLKNIGSLGVVGNVDALRQFGWSVVIQLASHHWPAEVNLAAFTSYVETKNWKWLEYIQHRANLFTNSVIELRENKKVKDALVQLEEELRRRKSLIATSRAISSDNKLEITLPALVIVFDRVSGVYNHAAFALILKEGRDLGVYGIFLTDCVNDIPSECGAYVLLDSGSIDYKITGVITESIVNIKADFVTDTMVEAFSKSLAKIDWLIPEQVTEPPETLKLLDLFPLINLDDLPLNTWWSGEHPFGYLHAPIGKFSPTAELIFDLNDSDTGHGPHGLIGGMTGSGKSELLKTMILSLSMTHHPYDLNFALIDYKGGGAFDGFEALPHVVGVITDIQNHADYATRVIQSLSWEVKRRERILSDARKNFELSNAHIDEYRKLNIKIPIPRLVIIFDEFAEFQERHSEESKKLINIARVGRSLGIHLILCTQNPMGKAVDQQIRDNSNFTICLKVKTPDTSKALVNIPDAIQLKKGEAFFHVDGPQKFRVAYTGGPIQLSSETIIRTNPVLARKYLSQPVSEAQAIIEEVSIQSRQLGIPSLPKIWPDPLPDEINLSSLFITSGEKPSWNGKDWISENLSMKKLVLGLTDDPLHQTQSVFTLQDHLLIFGSSSSGKSMTLLTLAKGISQLYSPEEAHIYCIDISGQSPLRVLEKSQLPHIPEEGGVILGNDIERLNRLFKMLQIEVLNRSNKLTTNNKDKAGIEKKINLKFPYIFVLIDGINQQFNANNPGFKDQLDIVMRYGAQQGIYIVMTGNLSRDIPETLQSSRTILLLRPTEKPALLSLVGRAPETYQKKIDAGQEPNAGRGILNTIPALEIQIATPVENDDEVLENLSHEFTIMASAWKKNRPPNVERLSEFIPLSVSKTEKESDRIFIGKGQESLEPIDVSLINDGPLFLISSMTSGLGKTSALHLWLLQFIKCYNADELKLFLIDFHSRTLSHFGKVSNVLKSSDFDSHIKRKEDLKEALNWLEQEVFVRRQKLSQSYADDPEAFVNSAEVKKMGIILIVIDDYEVFKNNCSLPDFQKLTTSIIDGEEVGIRLIVTEDYALLGNDELIRRVKKYGCGIMFGGSEGLSMLNDARPPYNQKTVNLPPGRGYWVRKGQVELMQSYAFWSKSQTQDAGLRSFFPNN